MKDQARRVALAAPALAIALVIVTVPVTATADTTYLQADFDNQEIDSPIGTGGPEQGEPVRVDSYLTAIVRDTPMSTPCLEIQDDDDYYAGTVRFEFTGEVEVTTGIVAVTCHLWFYELAAGHDFQINVREQGSSVWGFLDLFFNAEGSIRYSDEDSIERQIGTYTVGRLIPLAIVFDMDLATCDIWIDGALAVDGESHGVVGRGVGGVIFGCLNDDDLDGRFSVDDILVTDTYTPAPVTPASWGRIKALFE